MNLYCKVYVDADLDEQQLVERIAGIVGGTHWMGTVSAPGWEISIEANKDFDDARRSSGRADSFLFYRFYLDIEPAGDADPDRYIHRIAQLLAALRESGYLAVPSCDFEDRLSPTR